MRTDLRQRVAKIEAKRPPLSIWGDFAHRDSVPTRHRLWSDGVDVARWFKTGELPKDIGFFVMVLTEDDLEGVIEREDDDSSHELPFSRAGYAWHPFPELHSEAWRMLDKMVTFTGGMTDFYNFDGLVFRGVNGVLPPHEQVRELMPNG